MKACWGGGWMAWQFRLRLTGVSFRPLPEEGGSGMHWARGLLGPWDRMDVSEKRRIFHCCRESTHDCSVIRPVTYLLYQLSYRGAPHIAPVTFLSPDRHCLSAREKYSTSQRELEREQLKCMTRSSCFAWPGLLTVCVVSLSHSTDI